MKQSEIIPLKPVSKILRPEITKLPELSPYRRSARWLLIRLARILVWLFTKTQVSGLNNLPTRGPLLIVVNHLGDADLVIALAKIPLSGEVFVKSEMRDYPILGLLFRAYGVIWIHRGHPDRRALRAGIQGLNEGRIIGIAPEGRESLIEGLEYGTHGAAYLATKTDSPILPVTFTCTENRCIYPNMKHLRRTPVTITIGQVFKLESNGDWKTAIENGTATIMHKLAVQLPLEYRGVYRAAKDKP
jgi:1-acyl-sn-glycerol-3-phosphate acyltransferase